MALDHYVPQVHLKQFCLQETGRLIAMRKSDGKIFEPSTRNVCGIHEGNTNAYLVNDRAIEGLLEEIEPQYAAAVSNLEAGTIDNRTIFTIAGFVSAVYSCSPTSMRLHTPQLKELLGTSAELMDKHGMFDEVPVPTQLGADSLTELLQSGKVQFNVDGKYPQAVTISGVLELARVLGNSLWDILINELDDSPFLTSDFPIGLEPMGQVNGKVVPTSPRFQ